MISVIPIVVGSLGMISKGTEKRLAIGGRIEAIQTIALSKSARILRRVLESCGNYCHSLHCGMAQSARAAEYTDCISAGGDKTSPTSVLDI